MSNGTKPIDLDALAKKYGGAVAASSDLDALAKKHGGSFEAATVPDESRLEELKKAAPGLSGGATMSPRKPGILSWLQNLEADVRTGGDVTAPGRAMKKMGFKGTGYTPAEEFISSPVLGTVHAAQGLATMPQAPWQGTKQAVGGVMEALTIPGLLEAAPSEAGATTLGKVEELYKGYREGKKVGKAVGELQKINKLIGVGEKDIRLGKAPATMGEFVTNPARGVQAAGLDSKALAKMSPLERNKTIIAAKDEAGKALDQILQTATQQGKTVSLKDDVDAIFKQIPDRKLMGQTRARLGQVINKALGRPNVFEDRSWASIMNDLEKLTPTQARAIQRGLDDFANFAAEGTVKTFGDVAKQLRTTISKATRAVVPESGPADRQYSDMVSAAKGTEKNLRKFAKTAPRQGLMKAILEGAKREVRERPIRSTAYALGVPYVGHEVLKGGRSHVP